MEDNYFINEAFNYSLNSYLEYKNKKDTNWSFLIYVVEVLIYIYSENDILNPFITKEENVLRSNLLKFGSSEVIVNKLFNDINGFYKKDEENKRKGTTRKNCFFTYIQEDLIDLFFYKYKDDRASIDDLDNFQKIIFSNKCSNKFQLKINMAMEVNENEAINYFEIKKYELNNVLTFDKIKKDILNINAYKFFGLDEQKVSKLNSNDLKAINKKILNYFKFSPIEPNLNEKIIVKASKKCNNKINVYMFIIGIILVIIFGIYLGYKMVG